MDKNILEKLTSKDDKCACAFADKIISESMETDIWYKYFDEFASLLNHPKSQMNKVGSCRIYPRRAVSLHALYVYRLSAIFP